MLLESEFGQIAVILLVAAVAGFLAHLARQPVLVAYIFVGILLGPAMLGAFFGRVETRHWPD